MIVETSLDFYGESYLVQQGPIQENELQKKAEVSFNINDPRRGYYFSNETPTDGTNFIETGLCIRVEDFADVQKRLFVLQSVCGRLLRLFEDCVLRRGNNLYTYKFVLDDAHDLRLVMKSPSTQLVMIRARIYYQRSNFCTNPTKTEIEMNMEEVLEDVIIKLRPDTGRIPDLEVIDCARIAGIVVANMVVADATMGMAHDMIRDLSRSEKQRDRVFKMVEYLALNRVIERLKPFKNANVSDFIQDLNNKREVFTQYFIVLFIQ